MICGSLVNTTNAWRENGKLFFICKIVFKVVYVLFVQVVLVVFGDRSQKGASCARFLLECFCVKLTCVSSALVYLAKIPLQPQRC